MPTTRPSGLELQVLSVLWERGPSSARDVLEAMPDRKPRAYTTVLSVLQGMEKKGLITHTAQGPAHIFQARVRRREVLGPLMKDMITNVFSGRPGEAMIHLLQQGDLSSEELAEIRRLLNEQEQSLSPENEKGGGK